MADLTAPVASGLIGGAFSLAGGALNYKYNRKLMEQQNQYNIDMWKMQADYNSPQAQMQRFREAGLNPNLIYGQGSNGNMSQPPQLGVPEAPDFSEGAKELAKAFNIENLRTIVANRKKAQADADLARTNADRTADLYRGEQSAGEFDYDPTTGKYVQHIDPENTVTVYKYPAARYFKQKILAENFRDMYMLPYRSELMTTQKRYLQPQIIMSNYEARHIPYSFWIGQGSKVAGAIGNFIPKPKIQFSRSAYNQARRGSY